MSDDPGGTGGTKTPPTLPPSFRHPVTADQLPECPRFDAVFVDDLRGPMTAQDWAVLADYMARHQLLDLHVDYMSGGLPDLEFLAEFGSLTRLYVYSRDLASLDGLRHVPRLCSLVFGPLRQQITLEVLKDLPKLGDLAISEHSRNLDVISELPTLRGLTLTGVKRDDFDFLAGAANLEDLYTTHGRYGDLSTLASMPKLKMLTMYRTKVTDLAPLGQCTALQFLQLEGLPVGQLPNLAKLTELKVAELELKHLDDLSAIATAPNLRYLRVQNNTLLPEQFAVLAKHPTLEYLDANLKNDRLSYQANDIVELPRDVHWVYRSDFRAALIKQIYAD